MTPVEYLKIMCQIVEASESFAPAIAAAEREGLIDEALKARIVAAALDLWQIEKRLRVDRRTADEIGLHRMAVWRSSSPMPPPVQGGQGASSYEISRCSGPVLFADWEPHRDKDIT